LDSLLKCQLGLFCRSAKMAAKQTIDVLPKPDNSKSYRQGQIVVIRLGI